MPTAETRPQRRTLVKALRELVDRVNSDIFYAMEEKEINDSYQELLLAINVAERVLDRERQHKPQRRKADEHASIGSNNVAEKLSTRLSKIPNGA